MSVYLPSGELSPLDDYWILLVRLGVEQMSALGG